MPGDHPDLTSACSCSAKHLPMWHLSIIPISPGQRTLTDHTSSLQPFHLSCTIGRRGLFDVSQYRVPSRAKGGRVLPRPRRTAARTIRVGRWRWRRARCGIWRRRGRALPQSGDDATSERAMDRASHDEAKKEAHDSFAEKGKEISDDCCYLLHC